MHNLLELNKEALYNQYIDELSAHGQSDSDLEHKCQAVAGTRTKPDTNLGHKCQVVADTRINRLLFISNLQKCELLIFYMERGKYVIPKN